MKLDDQLRWEAGMTFDGENLQAVPQRQYAQIPWDNLAARVLENEERRQRERMELLTKANRDAQRLKNCGKAKKR